MNRKSSFAGLGIAFGAALGTALGIGTGNMGVWLAVGVAVGVGIDAFASRQTKEYGGCGELRSGDVPGRDGRISR